MFNPSHKVGKTVNNLFLESILGLGSFACTYLGESTRTKKRYAVKCMYKYGLKPVDLELVDREIQISRLLAQRAGGSHPNIVVFDRTFERDDCVYIVYEYITGGDLFSALEQRTQGFSDEETKILFMQILNGIDYCHRKGVYHRDLKPENILLDQHGSPKICDFGLATIEADTTECRVGTSLYMSPAMYRTKQTGTVSSSEQDVWSLMILLFNIRFAAHPWNVACAEEDEAFQTFLQDPMSLHVRFGASPDLVDLMRAVCIDKSITSVRQLKKAFEKVNMLVDSDIEYHVPLDSPWNDNSSYVTDSSNSTSSRDSYLSLANYATSLEEDNSTDEIPNILFSSKAEEQDFCKIHLDTYLMVPNRRTFSPALTKISLDCLSNLRRMSDSFLPSLPSSPVTSLLPHMLT